MLHRLHGSQSFLVVVPDKIQICQLLEHLEIMFQQKIIQLPQQLVKEVKCLRGHQMLVLTMNKPARERKLTNLLHRIVLQPFPSLSTVSAKDVRESGIEFDLVFVKVFVQLLGSQHLKIKSHITDG